MRTELGSIQKIAFGFGGYQDAMLGINFLLGGKSWSAGDFKGAWGVDWTERCKWTEQDRQVDLGKACMLLRDLLVAAKVQTMDQLQGKPIEATFDGNLLKSWRILEEVIQ